MDVGPDAAGKSAAKYRLLRILSAGLCAFVICAVFVMAVVTYIPYSFLIGGVTPAVRMAPFIAAAPFAVASAILLAVAEHKVRRLKRTAFASVFAALAAAVAAPVLMLILPWRDGLFIADGLIFFAVPVCTLVTFGSFSDRVGERKILSRVLVSVCAVIMTVAGAAFFIAIGLKTSLFAPTAAAAMALPVISLAGVFLGAGRMFSGGGLRYCDGLYAAVLLFGCILSCVMTAIDTGSFSVSALLPPVAFVTAADGIIILIDLFIISRIKTEGKNK